MGNLLALAGTFFLAGPKKQFRKMSDKDRRGNSIVFISTMILTIIAVEAGPFPGRTMAVLLMVVTQWMALVWYTLSYIPYGQKMALTLLKKCFGWCCTF